MKALVAVLAVVIVGGGVALFVAGSGDENETQTAAVSPAVVKETSTPATSSAKKTHKVKVTADGFSPSKLTVKSGDDVLFENDVRVDVASDPHPQHTLNEELNGGLAASSKGVLITLTKKGTFGYHDHLNPSRRATITVE